MKLLQFPTNARLFDSALRLSVSDSTVEVQCPSIGTVILDGERLCDLQQHLSSSSTARECALLVRRMPNTSRISAMLWDAMRARPGAFLTSGITGTRLFDKVSRCLVAEDGVELHVYNAAGESTTFGLSRCELFAVAVAVDMSYEDFVFADRFRMRYAGSEKVAELLGEAVKHVNNTQHCVLV